MFRRLARLPVMNRWFWALLFVVGCGAVKANQPDAGGGDHGDAAPDAPLVGEATITVKLGGVATAGRAVVFNEADGTIAGEAMTDANGAAKATVHAGATVTVAVSDNELVTIAGVAPGDEILLQTPKPSDGTTVATVTFGSNTEAPGKSYYRADLGNDQYVTAAAMTSGARELLLVRGNLDVAGKFHMVVGAYDANNRLISYQFQTGLTPPAAGSTNVSFANWRTDLVDIDVALSGAPAEATLLTVDSANEQSGFLYMPSVFGGADLASVTNGQAALVVPYLGSFGDFVQTTAALTVSNTEFFTWTRRVPRPAGDLVLGAADMPPRIAAPMLDTSTPAQPTASWTIDEAAGGDAIVLRLAWRDAGGGSYRWYAYVPPNATSLQFPVVPSALAAQSPAQTSIYTYFEVTHHDLTPLDGFAAFRVAPPLAYDNLYAFPLGFNRWVQSTKRGSL